MALRILDGVLILEFSSLPIFNPNLPGLRNDIGLIENYIDELTAVAKKLEKVGFY